MWKYNVSNLTANRGSTWNWKRNKSTGSPANFEQGSWKLLANTPEAILNFTEEESKTSQSWLLLGIKENSKSWEDLDDPQKTEQGIIQLFENITPDDFEINAQFPESKNGLLHEAAIKGKKLVLEKLMKYKPDINIQNHKGDTPIMSTVKACRKCRTKNICEEHLSCLKILMEANANLTVKNNIGLTVLSYATMCADEKREFYLKELLHIEEKKNFVTGLYQALDSKLDIQFLEELSRLQIKENLQEFMFGKSTLMQSVCEYGMIESAKRLLELGADPKFAPKILRTPIQLACIFSQTEILQILIKKDESLLQVKTKSERNLIHSTVKNTADLENAYECLKILLKHKDKININDLDKDRRTPLHYAVLHDRDECAVELLSNGANIDIEDKWKQTPLMRISKSAFEKYLDSMILDGSSDTLNEIENDENNDAEENRKNFRMKKKNKNKAVKESRTIIFDFANLFRKNQESHTSDGTIPRMTQSETNANRRNMSISFSEEYFFPTEILCKIKDTKRLEKLIEHPVLSIIIYFKWFNVRLAFYIYLFLYFLFCLLFTWYIYSTEDAPFKIIPAKNKGFHSTKLNLIATIITLVEATDMKIYLIVFILAIIFIFLFFECLKFSEKKFKYLKDMDNVLRLIVILFAILVILCLTTPIFSPYCPHLKAVSILLTWFELFLVVGKYPNLSYYVSTFRSASLNLLKFLTVHMILLIGFALSFHTLFRSSSTNNIFTNPLNALFKTIVMLTSEFDASNIPFDEYSVVSHLIFIVYIFIITIVLLNLMVAIAFKQVKKMGKNRHLYKNLAQIDYIKHFEDNFNENFVIRTIYNWFLPSNCCIGGSYTVTQVDMKLKVTVKGNEQEFNNLLIFETYPEEKVTIKAVHKQTENDKKWYKNINSFNIFKTCHKLHHSVIDNAQEIVSKRFSKNEESKRENSNSKTDFEILRNELIELRRFIQVCFDKKEDKGEGGSNVLLKKE